MSAVVCLLCSCCCPSYVYSLSHKLKWRSTRNLNEECRDVNTKAALSQRPLQTIHCSFLCVCPLWECKTPTHFVKCTLYVLYICCMSAKKVDAIQFNHFNETVIFILATKPLNCSSEQANSRYASIRFLYNVHALILFFVLCWIKFFVWNKHQKSCQNMTRVPISLQLKIPYKRQQQAQQP